LFHVTLYASPGSVILSISGKNVLAYCLAPSVTLVILASSAVDNSISPAFH